MAWTTEVGIYYILMHQFKVPSLCPQRKSNKIISLENQDLKII